MDGISKKIPSRPGFSKAILNGGFKEGRKLFSDDGLHCFRYEESDCYRTSGGWWSSRLVRQKPKQLFALSPENLVPDQGNWNCGGRSPLNTLVVFVS